MQMQMAIKREGVQCELYAAMWAKRRAKRLSMQPNRVSRSVGVTGPPPTTAKKLLYLES